MEYSLDKTCSVCGARITDGNSTGVGVECRYSFNKARFLIFIKDDKRRNDYYSIDGKILMPLFFELLEEKSKKFRSKFKKEFYASIKSQWENKKFVSKKQLSICEDWIYPIVLDDMTKYKEKIRENKKALLFSWKPTNEENQAINNYANKLRHEFRKKQKGE